MQFTSQKQTPELSETVFSFTCLTVLGLICTIMTPLRVSVSRELGLDELLKRCEDVVGKLHFPEKEPCYQAMAGTALFTHTSFDMLQNHSRYCRQLAGSWKRTALRSRYLNPPMRTMQHQSPGAVFHKSEKHFIVMKTFMALHTVSVSSVNLRSIKSI